MKKSFLIIFLFLSSCVVGQSIKRMSINSGGISSPNLIISAGQYVAFSTNISDNNISIGFQQPVRIPLDTVLSVFGDTIFCVKDSVVLVTKPSPYVNWYRNDTLISSQDSSKLIVKTSGVYRAILFDDFGFNELTRKVVITVNQNLLPPPSVTPLNICQGSATIPLVAIATPQSTLLWYGTDSTGSIGSLSAPTPSASTPGIFQYFVSQRNLDTRCESQRAKLVVTVSPTPAAPLRDSVIYCAGATAMPLNITAGNGFKLNWYGTNMTGGTASNVPPVISTAFAGRTDFYFSKVDTTTLCESPRTLLTSIINPVPLKPSIIKDDKGNLTSSSTTGNQWYKDTTLIMGAIDSLYKPVSTGLYTVRVNQNGCVSPFSENYFYLITALSDPTMADNRIKIYPNPSKEVLLVDLGARPVLTAKLRVLNAQGREVYKTQTRQQVTEIYWPELVSGTYLIEVIEGNKRYTVRVIKNE